MARLSRVEVFAADEVAIVHVMNRVVRRCFLLGNDPISGKNYDHRKEWIEELLKRFSACFGIDLLAFAIMSNHFHLILRSRPDVVETWDDTEVARRWLLLCPVRKTADRLPEEPNDVELNTIRNDAEKLAAIRLRLSDIGWWMRLLCQQVAVRANHEDQEMGKFWQSRFKAVRLLDEQALLACAAYVDLNPIRAAMSQTLEKSDYTSAQRRIQAITAAANETTAKQGVASSQSNIAESKPVAVVTEDDSKVQVTASTSPDGFLSPVALGERRGRPGPKPSRNGQRCSDKGFLPWSQEDYLQLLDWTARQMSKTKPGRTPEQLKPLFERLGLDAKTWCELVSGFGRLFFNVAGRPQTIDATPSRLTQQRYHVRSRARKLFASGSSTA